MSLREELAALLNRHSAENPSGTPDFILAKYLHQCLANWDECVQQRDAWLGHPPPDTDAPFTIPDTGDGPAIRCGICQDTGQVEEVVDGGEPTNGPCPKGCANLVVVDEKDPAAVEREGCAAEIEALCYHGKADCDCQFCTAAATIRARGGSRG
jgi:hypothetical protein